MDPSKLVPALDGEIKLKGIKDYLMSRKINDFIKFENCYSVLTIEPYTSEFQ